jgi:hypothetical protein
LLGGCNRAINQLSTNMALPNGSRIVVVMGYRGFGGPTISTLEPWLVTPDEIGASPPLLTSHRPDHHARPRRYAEFVPCFLNNQYSADGLTRWRLDHRQRALSGNRAQGAPDRNSLRAIGSPTVTRAASCEA